MVNEPQFLCGAFAAGGGVPAGALWEVPVGTQVGHWWGLCAYACRACASLLVGGVCGASGAIVHITFVHRSILDCATIRAPDLCNTSVRLRCGCPWYRSGLGCLELHWKHCVDVVTSSLLDSAPTRWLPHRMQDWGGGAIPNHMNVLRHPSCTHVLVNGGCFGDISGPRQFSSMLSHYGVSC